MERLRACGKRERVSLSMVLTQEFAKYRSSHFERAERRQNVGREKHGESRKGLKKKRRAYRKEFFKDLKESFCGENKSLVPEGRVRASY